jgi:hypothetical protein
MVQFFCFLLHEHGRMARAGKGLPKVSPGAAIPYPSMPCGWATFETVLQLFQRCPPQGRWPAAVFYPFGQPTPYNYSVSSTVNLMLETFTFTVWWV